jgi:hypothetical protein
MSRSSGPQAALSRIMLLAEGGIATPVRAAFSPIF